MINKTLIKAKPLIKTLRDRFVNDNNKLVEDLLLQYPAEKVQKTLEKKAISKDRKAIENLAYYYLRCGDIEKSYDILEKHNLQTSLIYIKAFILEGKEISPIIANQITHKGKLSKKAALLLAKGVKNTEDKEKFKDAVLRTPHINKEKAVWRLRAVGEASRRVGDYTEALTAYRAAFDFTFAEHEKLFNNNDAMKHPQKNKPDAFNLQEAWRALSDFQALALPGWIIDAGTLLGFIREGSFLKHDYDLDLGFVEPASFTKTRHNLFLSPLFELKPGRVKEVFKVRHANGMDIDIFLYQKTSDQSDQMFKESHVYRWDFEKFEPEIRQFKDASLPVPANPEKHLEATYGDWQVPQKSFDGRYDAYNVSFPNLDELECVLLNKATIALQKGNYAAAKKEINMLKRIGKTPYCYL